MRNLTLDELWHVELSTGRGTMHYALPVDQIIDPPPPRLTSLDGAPPLPQVWTHMDGAVHPPLYVILLRIWCAMFGDGRAAMRSFGTIASIASVILMFGAVREVHGTRAALWAAAIFGLAGAQVQAARDVRGYALLVALLLACSWCAVRIIRLGFNWRRAVGLALSTLAALLTHYFSVFPLAAIGACMIFLTSRRTRIPSLIAMALAVFLFAIVWIPQMRRQNAALPARSEPWIYDPDPQNHTGRVLFDVATVPMRLLIATQNGVAAHPWAVIGCALYVIPLPWIKRRPELLLWYGWLLAIGAGLAAMDLLRGTRHLLYMRYIVAAGPAVYALLAAIAVSSPWRHVVPALAAILCALFVWQTPEEQPRDYRSVATYLDKHLSDGAVVAFFAPAPTRSSQALFLCLGHVSERYPWPIVMLSKPPDAQFLARLREAPQLWLIVPGSVIPPEQVFGGGSRVGEGIEVSGVGSVSRIQFPHAN